MAAFACQRSERMGNMAPSLSAAERMVINSGETFSQVSSPPMLVCFLPIAE